MILCNSFRIHHLLIVYFLPSYRRLSPSVDCLGTFALVAVSDFCAGNSGELVHFLFIIVIVWCLLFFAIKYLFISQSKHNSSVIKSINQRIHPPPHYN